MEPSVVVSTSSFSSAGSKPTNQDFYGSVIPSEHTLSLKGAVFAIADGISTSAVSRIASEMAIKGFLNDYMSTSEAWTVKTAGANVLRATNSWLWAQTQKTEHRFNLDKGYVCTFCALIIKAGTAHIFHVGDSRVYRLRRGKLEQLTQDHLAISENGKRVLSRALGAQATLEIDYLAIDINAGDQFILCSDGVHEFWDSEWVKNTLETRSKDAAQGIVEHALERGSEDNLTALCVYPGGTQVNGSSFLQRDIDTLSLPPLMRAGDKLDVYTIIRAIHVNSRSFVYLAEHDSRKVILKAPAMEHSDDPAYLERFLLEEWVAKRIHSTHTMKAHPTQHPRTALYTVMEYIEGVTLSQWLTDNPNPGIQHIRTIVEQIARGLLALHRKEILHRDIRPENIMMDPDGTVRIIDFGGVSIAGLNESLRIRSQQALQGTALYTAPEYFLEDIGSQRSDQYSLAVLTYYMISGRFPYGTDIVKARTRVAQRNVIYRTVLDDEKDIPAYLDYTLQKALNPIPEKRYGELSEFVHDLYHPSAAYLNRTRKPLIERHPLAFWKSVSLLCFTTILGLLIYIEKLRSLIYE